MNSVEMTKAKVRIRNIKFSLYLLPEEYTMLSKGARDYGLSRAEYLRQLIVYRDIIGRHWCMDKAQGRELLNLINEKANNLNYLRYSTAPGLYAGHREWDALSRDFKELLCILGEIPFLKPEAKEEWAMKVQAFLLWLEEQGEETLKKERSMNYEAWKDGESLQEQQDYHSLR